MTANTRMNLWIATTLPERNALGSTSGVALGDFCLVDGVNLYTATVVNAGSSSWRPLGGLPTSGPTGLGAKNVDNTLNRSVYMLSAVTFRAVLDAAPSSVTLAPVGNLNWPANPTVLAFSNLGFALSGTSDVIPPNAIAWNRATYTIAY